MISPILIFDSREKWFPVGVEESLRATGARLPYNAASAGYFGVPPFKLRGKDEPDAIDFPADMKPVDLPPVGYHRAVQDGPLWWHLFVLWYVYNSKTYVGRGQHEGDIEVVMIGCKDQAGNEPVLVYGSQHHGGSGRVEWTCERRGGRPVIYVAEGSHANYLSRVDNLEDRADGKGRVLDKVEWRDFGSWAYWRGKWGNSDNSPGPISERAIWQHPAIVYGQAR